MNHDYTHCIDYKKSCLKGRFRAKLSRDLDENKEKYIGVLISYTSFKDTNECYKNQNYGMRGK